MQTVMERTNRAASQHPGTETHATLAGYMLKQLAAWGVRRIYGVLGDANLYLLDEIAKQRDIEFVACKHEGAAALMASAEAKLTGRIGACTATSGPGIANLMNGLGDAAMDRAGVLALTGQVPTDQIGTEAKQYVDQQKLTMPFAQVSELLVNAKAAEAALQRCMHASGFCGQVSHLSVPKDVWLQPVQAVVHPYRAYMHQPLLVPEQTLADVAAMLRQAKRPLLLLGRGVKGVAREAVALAEALQAGAIATMPARGMFPNDHPLFLGGLGHAGSEASSRALGESDLVCILGATWWPEQYVPGDVDILQFDSDKANIGMNRSVRHGVVGDLNRIVPDLLERVQQYRPDRAEWVNRLQELRVEWMRKANEAMSSGGDSPGALKPQRIMAALSREVAANAVIALDTGDHTVWFNRLFQVREQDIVLSGRWRTIGFGLPAAIAAKLEHPERQTVAIVGDGGFLQTAMELRTAVERRLAIIVVLLNNHAYAMETNRMRLAGLAADGSLLDNPDFARFAESMGARAIRVTSEEGLAEAFREAAAQDGPVLLDVQTAADEIVPHTEI